MSSSFMAFIFDQVMPSPSINLRLVGNLHSLPRIVSTVDRPCLWASLHNHRTCSEGSPESGRATTTLPFPAAAFSMAILRRMSSTESKKE